MIEEMEMRLLDHNCVEFYSESDVNLLNSSYSAQLYDSTKLKNKNDFDSRYSDFQTIDWLKDRTLSYLRSLYYFDLYEHGNLKTKAYVIWEKWSVGILLTMIGIVGALTAVLVNVGVHYLSDMRNGICVTNILYNQNECCWESTLEEEKCKQWSSWGEIFGYKNGSNTNFTIQYIVYVIVSVLFALFSGIMVHEIAPYASGGGISEIKTILSGFIMRSYLGLGTYIVKANGIILSAASGLMLGQEGPMVHITCCISNLFIRLFPKFKNNEADKREIFLAGSAAGVSLAFSAPLSGVLFSLEETSFYFSSSSLWKSFFVSLIGVSVVSSLFPYSNQHTVLYKVGFADWHVFELPIFALIGIIGGLYGALFTKLNIFWILYKKRWRYFRVPLIEVAIIAFTTSALSYPFYISRLSNHQLIRRMFTTCRYENLDSDFYCKDTLPNLEFVNPYSSDWSNLIIREIKGASTALIIKSILLILTFGIKVPTGIFIPSIVIGSLFGRIVGLIVEFLSLKYPWLTFFKKICSNDKRCIFPSLYAVIGGAAVLGGITQMTVCVVTIMVEITGKLSYILPLILTVMMAKWVSNGLLKYGIYEEISRINNYPFLSNKDEISVSHNVKEGLSCIERSRLITIPVEVQNANDIYNLMIKHPYSGYPVVFENNYLFGYVSYSDLFPIIDDKINSNLGSNDEIQINFTSLRSSIKGVVKPSEEFLRHILNQSPVIIHPLAPLNSVVYIFQKLGVGQILVVDQGIVLDIITRKDLINILHRIS